MRPSAVRFTRKARTIRSTVSVRRSGRPAVTPGGSDARISSSIAARLSSGVPSGRTTSIRSRRPILPNASWAAAMSMKTIEPDAARAGPRRARTAATRSRRSTPPATSGRTSPGESPFRLANSSVTRTESFPKIVKSPPADRPAKA